MTTNDPLSTVLDFFRSFEGNDVEEAVRFVADDMEYVNVPFGFEAGTVIGPDGMRAVLIPAFAGVIRNEFIVRTTATNADTVFVERLDRHRLANGWVELPVTGVFTVRDGKITHWRDYFDMNVFATQMAALA
ncbi:MAG: nuclear transport factor 2 family protein [Actinobacteria bacterium]|nr:nuclear transport factor 2 family protein [Actinomycetota bacterium]